jgi:hypothetical protein
VAGLPSSLDWFTRFSTSVGIPGTIALLLLWQIIPRMDTAIQRQDLILAQLGIESVQHTQLAAACGVRYAP